MANIPNTDVMGKIRDPRHFFYNHWGLLSYVILVAILVAGLWPFNFLPSNKVKWLPGRNGISVYGPGIIFSTSPRWDQAKSLRLHKEITLELWLHPRQETPDLPSILTFSDGRTSEIFLLGQWRSHLVIRSRTTDLKRRKPGKPYQEIGCRNAFLKDRDVFIAVTSNKDGSAIYVNGQLAKTYPRHRLLEEMTSENIRLILGSSPVGHSYWPGEIMGMAAYNRAISANEIAEDYGLWRRSASFEARKDKGLVGLYLFNEREGKIIHNALNPEDTLTIPPIYRPIRRIALALPRGGDDFRWNVSFFQDVGINILGFMPLGFFFCVLLNRQSLYNRATACVFAIMVGMGLSLAIELAQMYLPTRDSSLTDLINNSLGTILGVLLVPKLLGR